MAPAEYRLNADEVACVKKLAERYERNARWVVLGDNQPGQTFDPLGLPPEKRLAIFGVMEDLGLVVDVVQIQARYDSFHIAPKVLQVARTIHEQETNKEEPRDIVTQV